uniref:RING-type E3 ubiquitin transferase n=1 Tax=Kalanchoe fedtschenkoi TaxID=63787 RepID=A0A7N1A1A4_KALFE
MASVSGRQRSYAGRLVTDRNGHLVLHVPFFFHGRLPDRERTEERTEAANTADSESDGGPDDARVLLANPLFGRSIVLERVSDFVALFGDIMFQARPGQPPATKASIAALREVEIGDDEQDLECSICLEGMKVAKEMPCKHRFHSGCVDKWLRIHGSCPVCGYQMPRADEDGDIVRRVLERPVWVPFSITPVAAEPENSNHCPSQETEQPQTEDAQNSD